MTRLCLQERQVVGATTHGAAGLVEVKIAKGQGSASVVNRLCTLFQTVCICPCGLPPGPLVLVISKLWL